MKKHTYLFPFSNIVFTTVFFKPGSIILFFLNYDCFLKNIKSTTSNKKILTSLTESILYKQSQFPLLPRLPGISTLACSCKTLKENMELTFIAFSIYPEVLKLTDSTEFEDLE